MMTPEIKVPEQISTMHGDRHRHEEADGGKDRQTAAPDYPAHKQQLKW